MNQQISRLAVAGLVLVTSLIVATTYWQAWAAPSLAERQDNAIKVVAQFTIKRGGIFAGDSHAVSRDSKSPDQAFELLREWIESLPEDRREDRSELLAHHYLEGAGGEAPS